MPAVLGHWVVAEKVARKFLRSREHVVLFSGDVKDQVTPNPALDPTPWTDLSGLSTYYLLGANGPDLPYHYYTGVTGVIKRKLGKSRYADVLHYNETNEIVLQLAEIAKKSGHARTMSYALGHLTHIVADTVVHPYVNCFAGAYPDQLVGDMHQTVEMHQDSALAKSRFGRTAINEGRSWKDFVPRRLREEKSGEIYDPEYGRRDLYKSVPDERAKAFLQDFVAAFRATYPNLALELEHLEVCWDNFYNKALLDYDLAWVKVVKEPDYVLVDHENLYPVYLSILLGRATAGAFAACEALIEFYDHNDFSNDAKNRFRSKVRNWNLDTGYWIDVGLEGKTLKITWRHRYLDPPHPEST